jgi:anti-sigma factor RsiW
VFPSKRTRGLAAMTFRRELTCRRVIELAGDYLEGALRPGERRRVGEHLAGCEGCREDLRQLRLTVGALRATAAGVEAPRDLPALLAAFRDRRAPR